MGTARSLLLVLGLGLLTLGASPAAGQESMTDLDPPPQAAGGDEQLENLNDLTIPELVALARTRFENENFLLAKNLVRIILLRDEANIEASLLDAEMALVEGETDRARSRYNAVLAIEPTEYEANYGLGKLYARSKLFRQAKFYLERAESNVPDEDRSELLTLLARTYRGTGDAAQALEKITRAVASESGDTLPAWEYLVKLRIEGQDFDQALIDSGRLVSLARRELVAAPAELKAVERLYAAYNTQLEVLRALHQSQYELNPDGTRSDRLQAGNEVTAAETLRRVVDVMIVQAELLRTISYFSMLELTGKAVDYDENNLGLQMQHGLLLKNTSQFTEARSAFERVLQADPTHAEAQRQLASLPAAPITADEPDVEEEPAAEPENESDPASGG